MNLLTIEKLRILSKSLSRQELIDKYYTEDQKKEFKRLKFISILLIIILCVLYTIPLLWCFYFQLQESYMAIAIGGLGVIFIIIAAFVGRAVRKTRKKCEMAVLSGVFYQEIIGDHVNDLDEGLNRIRFHKFRGFCKEESIAITKEHLLFLKEQLINDLKNAEIDNFSSVKKWFKATLIPLGTSLFSVYLAKCVNIKDITSIFTISFLITFLIGDIIFLFNTWDNSRRIKRMSKYQDLLKTIDIAQFELIKEYSRLLS